MTAKVLELCYEDCISAIRATVPPKFVEINEKAFELGYNL
jgi:Pyruvate/2-oxoacid:ferredoxin oxidoreductase gamma subunit